MADKPTLESTFERGLFASRWLMAPMYLGLVVSLAMLTVVRVDSTSESTASMVSTMRVSLVGSGQTRA